MMKEHLKQKVEEERLGSVYYDMLLCLPDGQHGHIVPSYSGRNVKSKAWHGKE